MMSIQLPENDVLRNDPPNHLESGPGTLSNPGDGETRAGALNHVRTARSVSMSPELFEKLYLSPNNRAEGELRKTFGNPTPLALVGFLVSVAPLSCDLMGWRGAGGHGAASTGVYFFFGGLLMILGSIGEWIIGNTFPFVVFGTFGAFWLAFAATLVPSFNAYGAYVSDPTQAAEVMGNPENLAGLQSPAFNASFAFILLFMALICFIFLICSLRTNIFFFLIFLTLMLAFALQAGAHWSMALAHESAGNASPAKTAGNLTKASGACLFLSSLAGWWIFLAIMLESLDFPLQLLVGDLSTIIRGASERRAATSAV